MAKIVSVSPIALKVKSFTFQWTVDNYSQLFSDNSGTSSFLLDSADVGHVNMLKWSALISLTVCEYGSLTLDFEPLDQTRFKVFIVGKKKRKLKIHPTNWGGLLISKGLLLSSKDGFLTNDKLTLEIEVDCANVCNCIEAQSSAGVAFQDSPNHLRSGFTQLFDSKQCSDVTLNVGDYTVKAHKAILIASSPVFAAMFQHDMQEQQLDSVTITDISPEALEGMLRFIYTGDIPNLDTMVEHLLKAADKYEILKLKLECEESLQANISIKNAAYTLMLADRYNAELLKAKTLDYITLNAKKVMKTENWKAMVKTGSNVHLVEAAFSALALKYD